MWILRVEVVGRAETIVVRGRCRPEIRTWNDCLGFDVVEQRQPTRRA